MYCTEPDVGLRAVLPRGPTETQTERPCPAGRRRGRRARPRACWSRWRKRRDSNPPGPSRDARFQGAAQVGRRAFAYWSAVRRRSRSSSSATSGLWSALMSTGRATASLAGHPGDLPARGRGRPLRPEAMVGVPGLARIRRSAGAHRPWTSWAVLGRVQ